MGTQSDKRSVAIAKGLGYAGLVPFVCTVVVLIIRDDGPLTRSVMAALTGYSAIILSFMGAVHWGRAMFDDCEDAQRVRSLVISVCPAILAWFAMLTPTIPRLLLLMCGFLLLYWYDVKALASDPQLRWYLGLRLRLSSVVLVCLALALLLFI